jgi:hypothetical protein
MWVVICAVLGAPPTPCWEGNLEAPGDGGHQGAVPCSTALALLAWCDYQG